MASSKKRSVLKKALRGKMSYENPDVLMDYKMQNMYDNMDNFEMRMEDKEDKKQGIIRNKVTRKIIGKIQTY